VPRPEGDLGIAATASREAEPVAISRERRAFLPQAGRSPGWARARATGSRSLLLQEGTRRMVEGPRLALSPRLDRAPETLPAPSARSRTRQARCIRRPISWARASSPAPQLGRLLDAAGGQPASTSRAQGSASESSFAEVELNESQRRTFSERPSEGLLLARRAAGTFGELGLADFVARSRVAEGLALSYLNRDEEAVKAYEAALAAFERLSLWNGWLSALNNLTGSLVALGRGDAARRELARALKKTSRAERPALHAYLLQNLGLLLLDADRPAEARRSFRSAAELFATEGDLAAFATSSLCEVEALARAGRFREARERLDEVRSRTAPPPSSRRSRRAARGSQRLEAFAAARDEARGVLRITSGRKKFERGRKTPACPSLLLKSRTPQEGPEVREARKPRKARFRQFEPNVFFGPPDSYSRRTASGPGRV
jgi:tetratricopeptide (TPR) repeat protein